MIKYFTTDLASVMTAPPPDFLPEEGRVQEQYSAPYVAHDLNRDAGRDSADFLEERPSGASNGKETGESAGDTNAAQKIRQSIAYMKQRLDRPLQVAALAANVNISQSHYFAIFKRLTGCTPIDFFIHLRIQQACHLLKTTPASVKEVAGSLGYDDPFYFSRVFRSVQGIAPSEYRVLHRGMNGSAAGCHANSPNAKTGVVMASVPRHSKAAF